ncbi:TlpA family protein disulfide reductase [Emticicia fluvialis]|uniref:TlpA family protein disulfide reductase n=1 Tax=Emticicia fluvialis TaxID=2974474 RepID=UPI0021654831|nr:TlpA disulfide reductase family protein [Emticicia fluvialis]
MKTHFRFLSFFMGLCATVYAKQDSTIIIVDKKKAHTPIFVQYNGNFGGYKVLELNENKTETLVIKEPYPIRLISNDTDKKYRFGRQLSFVIYPGEKLYLSKNKDNVTYIRSLSDSTRNNELDFFNEFEKICGQFEGFAVMQIPVKISGIARYKQLEANYNKRIAFLNEYRSRKPIRDTYYQYLKALFLNDYLVTLAAPYFSPYEQKRLPQNKEITAAFENNFISSDQFFYESSYRAAVLSYVLLKSGQDLEKTGTDYKKMAEIALNTLSGPTLEAVLLDIINLNKQNTDKSINLRIAEKLASIAQNPFIRSFATDNLLPFYKTTQQIGNNLPLLNGKYEAGELNDIFKKSGKRFYYVDFWASWCGPCRAEMPASHKLKAEYAQKDIGFVYISTDEDPNAWSNAMQQLGIAPGESYLLPSGNASAIAKRFNISSIPRYLLIDAHAQIISDNAPRPSDPEVKRMFDKLLNN